MISGSGAGESTPFVLGWTCFRCAWMRSEIVLGWLGVTSHRQGLTISIELCINNSKARAVQCIVSSSCTMRKQFANANIVISLTSHFLYVFGCMEVQYFNEIDVTL